MTPGPWIAASRKARRRAQRVSLTRRTSVALYYSYVDHLSFSQFNGLGSSTAPCSCPIPHHQTPATARNGPRASRRGGEWTRPSLRRRKRARSTSCAHTQAGVRRPPGPRSPCRRCTPASTAASMSRSRCGAVLCCQRLSHPCRASPSRTGSSPTAWWTPMRPSGSTRCRA
ncbi:hypothetical protein B0H21DRAFT_16122 [Amylocystis lapponica]|nr:hypothetical protein B0H21DRAFT_16122 [Amylocystis lapponica]